MRFVLVLVALLAAGSARAADTLVVVPEVPRSVVRLGEPFRYRVVVPGPGTLTGPPAPASEGDLDLLRSGPGTAAGDSTAWEMTLAWFRPGETTVPALPLLLSTAEGTVPVRTAPWRISVEATVDPDSAGAAGLRDLKGPLEPDLTWRWGRIALAALGLALLAAAIVLWLRRSRPDAPAAPVRPAEPAHVIALRSLDNLAASSLPERGRMKDHYVGLSAILRRYVEDAFRTPAVESTTDEIAAVVPRLPLPAGEGDRLLALLADADLVKFAKQDPGAARAAEDLARARTWVEATRPRPAAGGPAT
jgi:hypothetical protein